MVNRRQVIKSAAAAATVLAMPKYASALSAFNGFYPAGNWIPAKQPMIQVYPRPDSETNTWARHRWAYYDGVNAVQYTIPLGVSFGAFPYVYQLLSGPPGMTIGATVWQSGWSFAQAAAAGYGYLQWTPTGSVSGATVSVLVTDQQMKTLTITFTVSTSSAPSRFIFVDAVNGNDSGAGSISAPLKTFNKVLGGYASALCYFRSGTYTFTATGNTSGENYCLIGGASQPSAYMGFPGDTPPVITMTSGILATKTGPDLFMQGLNPNGYDASSLNARFFWATGAGNDSARQTFDNNVWSNSGVNTGGSNATGYFIDGNDVSSLIPYTFINNCSETNRVSSSAANSYGGCSFYGAINPLVQGCSIVQSGLQMGGCFYFKSDVQNGCMRGNTANVGSGLITHTCDWGQENVTSPPSTTNGESCYNTMIATSYISMWLGNTFSLGPLWVYRNSIIGAPAFITTGSGGPYTVGSNAVQGITSLPSGITDGGNNLLVASGLLDSNGNLTASYASYLGTVGAQIAISSSVLRPTAPSLKVT
jgi:hypothetical protein